MLSAFGDVCIMGANYDKTNREITWLKKIFVLFKVFFGLSMRQTDNSPQDQDFCGGCFFPAGVPITRPFFYSIRGWGLRSCGTKALDVLILFAGQDKAPVETDLRGPVKFRAGRGLAPSSPCSCSGILFLNRCSSLRHTTGTRRFPPVL